MAQIVSTTQIIEVWLYQDKLYTAIDAAIERLRSLFEGYMFTDCFPVEWIWTIDRQRDTGALRLASLARIDFAVYEVIGD